MSSKDTHNQENTEFIERFIEVCNTAQAAEIARLLNISYQAAKNYLQGRLPKPSVLISISENTPYSIHWLLTGKGEKFVSGESPVKKKSLTEEEKKLIKERHHRK